VIELGSERIAAIQTTEDDEEHLTLDRLQAQRRSTVEAGLLCVADEV